MKNLLNSIKHSKAETSSEFKVYRSFIDVVSVVQTTIHVVFARLHSSFTGKEKNGAETELTVQM